MYDAVGDHFRSLWGKEAGWAHSVLFTADLRAFSERLPTNVELKELIKDEETETSTKSLSKASIDIKVKRDFKEEEPSPIFLEEIPTTKTVKRRRKA